MVALGEQLLEVLEQGGELLVLDNAFQPLGPVGQFGQPCAGILGRRAWGDVEAFQRIAVRGVPGQRGAEPVGIFGGGGQCGGGAGAHVCAAARGEETRERSRAIADHQAMRASRLPWPPASVTRSLA